MEGEGAHAHAACGITYGSSVDDTSKHRNALQHTAMQRNALQHIATHCNTPVAIA